MIKHEERDQAEKTLKLRSLSSEKYKEIIENIFLKDRRHKKAAAQAESEKWKHKRKRRKQQQEQIVKMLKTKTEEVERMCT